MEEIAELLEVRVEKPQPGRPGYGQLKSVVNATPRPGNKI